jgi:hypothetical protein
MAKWPVAVPVVRVPTEAKASVHMSISVSEK